MTLPRLLGVLLALTAVPFPVIFPGMHGLGPPGTVWPALWCLTAAVIGILALVADYSRPVAVFVGYVALRVVVGLLLGVHEAAQRRALYALVCVLAGAFLYALIARAPQEAGRTLRRVILGIAAVQLVLGMLDVAGVPHGLWQAAHNAGLPHGLLGHPNHWGLYMALALPALYAEKTILSTKKCVLVVVLGPLLVAVSHSMGAIGGAALVRLLGLRVAWPGLRAVPAWAFYMVPAVAIAAAGLALRTLPLGGRGTVWQLAGEAFVGWPWPYQAFGTNLGSWWLGVSWGQGPLVLGSVAHNFPPQGYSITWWETAHNDAGQAVFELGLVGGLLGAWVLAQILRDIVTEYRSGSFSWSAGMAVVALVALPWTLAMHQPFLAFPILVAVARLRAEAYGPSRLPRGVAARLLET